MTSEATKQSQRTRAAARRSTDMSERVTRLAKRVTEEMDEITETGVPTAELSAEDSAVIAVGIALETVTTTPK